MTAPDVDALEAARAAAEEFWHDLISEDNQGAVDKLTPLLAAVRERDALRAAVEGLALDLGPHARLYDTAYIANRLRALLAAVDGGRAPHPAGRCDDPSCGGEW